MFPVTLRYTAGTVLYHSVDNLLPNFRVSKLAETACEVFSVEPNTFELRLDGNLLDINDQIYETELSADNSIVDVIITRPGIYLFRKLELEGVLKGLKFSDRNLGRKLCKAVICLRHDKKQLVSLVLKLLSMIDYEKLEEVFSEFALESSDDNFDLILGYININFKDSKNENALLRLIKSDNLIWGYANRLIRHGIDIELKDSEGRTSLMLASERGYISIVRYLLKAGARVDEPATCDASTALFYASIGGNHEILNELIAAGADIHKKNIYGNSPIILAADRGHHLSVIELVKAGADVNSTDENGTSILMYASDNANLDTVKYLLIAGANVNQQAKKGNSPLIFAIDRNQPRIVKYLLDHGAMLDLGGVASLPFAVAKGYLKVVEVLLRREVEVDVNVQTPEGDTSLILAIDKGYNEIAKMLLKAEDDPNIKNDTGESAIMLTSDYEMIRELIFHGARDVTIGHLNTVIKNRDRFMERKIREMLNLVKQ